MLRSRSTCPAVVLGIVALLPCIALACGSYPLDLDVYRAGGRAICAGLPLYDVRVHGYGFTYPPFAALLFTGISTMPLGAATAVATACSLVALGLVLRWTCWTSLDRTRDLVLVAGLAACEPVRSTLWHGQIDLVLAAAALADVLGMTPRRWRGTLIGAAAATKLTPAIFVVYLLARGRRADAVRACVSFTVLSCLAWVVLPIDSQRFWMHQLVAGAGIGDVSRTNNQSLYGVALRLCGAGPAAIVWPLLAVAVATVGIRLAVDAGRCGHESLAAGVVGVVGCLVSPVAWTHHWIWCIPCIAGLAVIARDRAEYGWAVGLGVLAVGTYLVPRGVVDSWAPTRWTLGNGFVLAALATGVLAAARTLHSPGVSAKPELALVYGECQPVTQCGPSFGPFRRGAPHAGPTSVSTPRVRYTEWPS